MPPGCCRPGQPGGIRTIARHCFPTMKSERQWKASKFDYLCPTSLKNFTCPPDGTTVLALTSRSETPTAFNRRTPPPGGWKVAALPGNHLLMLFDPNKVADTLDDLLQRIGFHPEPAR